MAGQVEPTDTQLLEYSRRLYRCANRFDLAHVIVEAAQQISGCGRCMVFTIDGADGEGNVLLRLADSLGLDDGQRAVYSGLLLPLGERSLASLAAAGCLSLASAGPVAAPFAQLLAPLRDSITRPPDGEATEAVFAAPAAERPAFLICCLFHSQAAGAAPADPAAFPCHNPLAPLLLLLDDAAHAFDVQARLARAEEHQQQIIAIRAEQERIRAVVDATNDAILLLDDGGRVLLINRRAKFFFGLAERDVQGKSFEQLGAQFKQIFAEAEHFIGWLNRLLRSQAERAVEEFRTLRPEERLLQCFTAPVTDQSERSIGRILVFRDITREREVDRMKSDFVSVVSHELRTPLTSIHGALQLVLGRSSASAPPPSGFTPRTYELLNISLTNTERLIRLINDILDIARIEQGRIQLHREILTPETLCRVAQAEVIAAAAARNVTLDLDLPPWLPPVYADRDRIVQVLTNLLSNAIKFSAPGQRVVIGARQEGGAVHFSVRDWGRGIALSEQERIFQKFYQADGSATRDVGGTGLGLAICKALVEEHQGRIWLESAPAAGSTFSFSLPLMLSGAQPQPRAGQRSRSLVLLADSNGDLREVLRQRLEGDGYGVIATGSGAEAIQLARALRPALIIFSPALSQPNEFDLARLLEEELLTRDIPLLTLAPEAGPDQPDQLIQAVRQAIGPPAAHVLVVDDDPHVRPVLVRLLQRHGFRVTDAWDGQSALLAVAGTRPDIMLLDIKMPGIDGYEVLRRIKITPATSDIPVIILTANELGGATHNRAMALGAARYLEKPIPSDRLIDEIERVLAGRPKLTG